MSYLPRFALVAIGSLLVAGPSPAVGAFVGYLKFDGIDGESVVLPYRGWSEVTSVQIDVGQSPPESGSTRGSAPTFAMSFSMPLDISYPSLALATLQGQVFQDLRVAQVDDTHGGAVIEHEFQTVSLGSLRLTETAAGQTVVGEIASLNFYQTTYNQYDDDGQLVDSSSFAYDFQGGAAAISARLPGDYNADGLVNEADRSVWAQQHGVTMVTLGGGADGNADGLVDAADYTIWRDHDLPTAVAVPEPTSLGLLLGVVVASARFRL